MNQSKLIAAPVSAAIGYAIGNFNPSYLVGKMKGYDVRESGTGNAGASNTFMLAISSKPPAPDGSARRYSRRRVMPA